MRVGEEAAGVSFQQQIAGSFGCTGAGMRSIGRRLAAGDLVAGCLRRAGRKYRDPKGNNTKISDPLDSPQRID